MAERKTVEAIGAPEAAGPYSHAVAHGGILYCSGQVPIDPETGKLVEDGPGEQATRCLANLEVVCAAADTSLARALMVNVFVTDLSAGGEVNAAYAGWPDRMYVVGTDGRIAYQGGPGPRGFLPAEVEKWLKANVK